MKSIEEILNSVDLRDADSNKEKFERLFLGGEFEDNYQVTEYLYNHFSKEELSVLSANLYVDWLKVKMEIAKSKPKNESTNDGKKRN